MKKRKIAIIVLVSTFTWGLYILYWVFTTREELVKKGYNIRSFNKLILLHIIAAIILFPLAIAAAFGNSEDPAYKITQLITLSILSALLFFIIRFLNSYGRAVQIITANKITVPKLVGLAVLTGVLYLAVATEWIDYYLQIGRIQMGLVASIFAAIIQRYFNQIPEALPQQPVAPQPQAMAPPPQPSSAASTQSPQAPPQS